MKRNDPAVVEALTRIPGLQTRLANCESRVAELETALRVATLALRRLQPHLQWREGACANHALIVAKAALKEQS